jgi:hypothetical protein
MTDTNRTTPSLAKQLLGSPRMWQMLSAGRGALVRVLPPVLRRMLYRAVDAVPPLARVRNAHRLRYRMRTTLGYEPDFRHPRTFNERVACKILYDRNPLIPLTIDKVAVREYVAAKVGPEILIPLLGVWDQAADVPWDELPDRFALKGCHGWQMNLLVHDKARTDRDATLRLAERWLSENHYEATGEWGYRHVRPRLLAEALLTGDRPSGIPEDFKFFVFHGKPYVFEVHFDRGTDSHSVVFYDAADLRPLPSFGGYWCGELPGPLPPATRDLVGIAARLGADFDFVRVDLYLAEERAWFGELTHYPASACDQFASLEQDRLLGDMWAGKA